MRESTTSERFDLYTPAGFLLGEFRLYRTASEREVEHWARVNIYGGPSSQSPEAPSPPSSTC